MRIEEIFNKDINRDIKGVIKVGQNDDENKRQELEEYVVTNELQKHFTNFFSAYASSINGDTDKMGVWISGFFGSGKSHLLKILSYLVSDQVIDGKHAMEYFLEENKIKDGMVEANMQLAKSITCDSILFNIDSKNDSNSKKENIVLVFLMVFNEKIGLSKNPHVADLERVLIERGLYKEFQNAYKNKQSRSWEEGRNRNFRFEKGTIQKLLVQIGFGDESDAEGWAKSTTEEYSKSIEDFAKMVNEYIEQKDSRHHVVFFVDEIGQYIGDNVELMLNLQTVTEDLGTFCGGKAWVVVTSQEAIDKITEVKGNDFSKIQGRFDTRISLQSSDVSEVIKKRLLEKKKEAIPLLESTYEISASDLENKIYFEGKVYNEKFTDVKSFEESYPFVPYQFRLLGNTLQSIRANSSSGKHMSMGERSLLALYQESAQTLKESNLNTLVSFNIFYDALEKFIDTEHATVINHAKTNEKLNDFDVEVLKVLFLIKNVKEFHATLENVTTLMIDSISANRNDVKSNVKESCERLEIQTLVQKSSDVYIFLSNEEQEMERQIKNIPVEDIELHSQLLKIIKHSIIKDSTFKLTDPRFSNFYIFNYSLYIDDQPVGNKEHDIKVKIYTPNSYYNKDINNHKIAVQGGQEIRICLDEHYKFIEELKNYIRIDKFLRITKSPTARQTIAIDTKNREKTDLEKKASREMELAFNNAQIFYNSEHKKLENINFQIDYSKALDAVINYSYNKLQYIDKSQNTSSVALILNELGKTELALSGIEYQNSRAINEVYDLIKNRLNNANSLSIYDLRTILLNVPFGYVAVDVDYILAALYVRGDITLKKNNVEINSENPHEIQDYISKKEHVSSVTIELIKQIDMKLIRSVKEIGREIFGIGFDEKEIKRSIKTFKEEVNRAYNNCETIKNQIVHNNGVIYPGQKIFFDYYDKLEKMNSSSSDQKLLDYVYSNSDDILDAYDAYEENLDNFFTSGQKDIWNKAYKFIEIFNSAAFLITIEELNILSEEIQQILNDENPFSKINLLHEKLNRASSLYTLEVTSAKKKLENTLEEKFSSLNNYITKNNCEKVFELKINEYKASYSTLIQNAEDILKCHNLILPINNRYDDLYKEINIYLDSIGKKIVQKKPVRLSKYIPQKTIIRNSNDVEQFINSLRINLEKELEDGKEIELERE